MDETSRLAVVEERLVSLTDKITAAHNRVDRVEVQVRDDLREIMTELKALSAHMNRGKGWAAAFLLLASLAGAIIAKLLVR